MEIFTLGQWLASGKTRYALKRALRDSTVIRMLKGVYRTSDVPDTLENRARAIALVRPSNTVVCRAAAAWLAGIDVLPPGTSIGDVGIDLAVPSGQDPPRLPGCRGHETDLPDDDLVEEFGVARTSDLRTAVDLARFCPRSQAVAAADAFLNARRVTLDALWERARLLTQVRNCRVLRANLAVADPGSQSYSESDQRVLFIDAGLPRPRTQIPVFRRDDTLIGYLDMGWDLYRVASEFDGVASHSTQSQHAHDHARRSIIAEESDWYVDVTTAEQLWGTRAALVAHTAELLCRRGWDPPAQVLDQISQAAWFESRTGQRWQWMPLDRLLAS